ncbi:cystathionine gamma-synthase [Syntrophotalea acetylenivorans]|uniref:cysteine-S-conjugate beta-lyase n=1 Tax=Syntrophotalea acetylenivorans TaxID=1842532 RepID=A0A1L3GNB1_9BACT|nr:PLP-dependent transferase [Syntrophotalea acetylenivorans]APG27158.1 cystathionine gamma-synthase [Syntrophotalea acetylenivorans]
MTDYSSNHSDGLRPATLLVHQGRDRDSFTGAATVPIYTASTYHQHGGRDGAYDYARSGNPSREQVEDAIALLEGGTAGFAYASGMAAIAGALALLDSGDHLLASSDLYGGSYRYLSTVLPRQGITVDFVDTTDAAKFAAAIRPETRAIFIETPSNPLFRITSLRAMVELAQHHNLLTILDNTFMTPLLLRPLELGVDVVVHSATKFLGGHSDLLAGLAVTADADLARRLKHYQNAAGNVLAPFDAFLLSRGMKTLKIRLEAAQAGAGVLAERLSQHPAVQQVLYPGLTDFPHRARHFAQSSGPGAVLSFILREPARVAGLLKRVRLPIIAPSLGGVETILTHCWSMSHAAVPDDVKASIGLSAGLLRLSVGIEDVEDLWRDLEQSLEG